MPLPAINPNGRGTGAIFFCLYKSGRLNGWLLPEEKLSFVCLQLIIMIFISILPCHIHGDSINSINLNNDEEK